jgi:hypothetical protein
LVGDLEARLDVLVREHGGVLTTSEAYKAGMTRSALQWARRSSALISLRHGVHTSARLWAQASPVARHQLRILAQQRVNPGLVACGASAAAVLELPLPDGPPPQPLLTAARDVTRLGAKGDRAGASGRRSWLAAGEICTLDSGVRVTSPMRTVIDCAREWAEPWGLAVADAAIGLWPLDRAELVSAVSARPPMPGCRRARWVAEHARPGVESPLESLARGVIVLAGLPEPTPQVWIDTGAGPVRVDLLDEANRLITEADGKLKYSDPEVLWREKRREDALREQGFEVVRFAMSDYHRPLPWLATYRRALDRSARRAGDRSRHHAGPRKARDPPVDRSQPGPPAETW